MNDYVLNSLCDGLQSSPVAEGDTTVFVNMGDMAALRDALLVADYALTTSLQFVPKDGFLLLTNEEFELNMEAIDAFEALDDVDSVHHNIDTNTGDEE